MSEVRDRAQLLLEDMLAGPDTLAAMVETYARDDGPLAALPSESLTARRFLFVGMGSSRFAALTVAAALAAAGRSVTVEHASTGQPVSAAEDLAVFAVSSSGTTPEVAAAVRRHRGRSLVVGVTNDPRSPVGLESDVCLPLVAGRERAGVATRTYAATLAVLATATAGDSGAAALEGIRHAIGGSRTLHAGRDAWVDASADVLDGAGEVHVLGDGSRLGSLEQAALLLREGPRLAALAVDAGDWLHTAVYTMLPGGRAMLFSGTPYDDEIAATIRGRRGELVTVGPPVEGAAVGVELGPLAAALQPVFRAIVEIAAAELVAAALWSRASAVEGTLSDR